MSMAQVDSLLTSLKQHFGHTTFKPGQREMIDKLMAGRSVFGMMATGGGKSITYQLPALLLPGLTVVISPLISLMVDQVNQLRLHGRRDVAYLNSALPYTESRQLLDELTAGKYKLLYVSPEKLLQPALLKCLQRRGVSLVAIDEAHCISQWGHDFRTDYLRLPEVVQVLGAPPVLALTATATRQVVAEICQLFAISPEDVVMMQVERDNIAYDVIPVASEQEKQQRFISALQTLQGPGIIYCSTRQAVDQLTMLCREAGITQVHGFHGGQTAMERMMIQEQFIHNQLNVIVATNAFGMGINKADIRYVLHYHFPASIEAYVQETGRVGRDGNPGYAGLYYLPSDAQIHHHLIRNEWPPPSEMENFLKLVTACAKAGQSISLEQVLHLTGLMETTVRMLFYYAERVGLVTQVVHTKEGYRCQLGTAKMEHALQQMIEACHRSASNKQKKLRDIMVWLEQKECLRQGLGRYFSLPPRETSIHSCCSRCGIEREPFCRQTADSPPSEQQLWSLAVALRQLLPAGQAGANKGER